MVNKKSKHKISDSQKKNDNDINKIKKSIINKISGGSASGASTTIGSEMINLLPLVHNARSSLNTSTQQSSSVAEPTTEPKVKSKRYFDEDKKVHDFEAKYMQDSSIYRKLIT